jgi:ATP:ADP antiporter, AAA family
LDLVVNYFNYSNHTSRAKYFVAKILIGIMSAEKDKDGNEFLADEPWTKMGVKETASSKAMAFFDKMVGKATGGLEGDELLKVSWLSITLFFIVGGYWLLRSLKDPIMSVISGVEYIPQAKMASLFVVFGLVIIC